MAWPDVSGRAYAEMMGVVLREGRLTEGEQTRSLETDFVRYLGAEDLDLGEFSDYQIYAVAVSSGTFAIEALLRAWGVGPGHRVFVPALTFSGTALPVLRVGASLCFADVHPRTYNVTQETLEEAGVRHDDFVIPVDLHGLPCAPISVGRGRLVDACQSLGASYLGTPAGLLGDGAVFSLNATKTVFGGEGGIVVTRSFSVAEKVMELRRYSEKSKYQAVTFTDGGYNGKITEMAAGIARVSLRELPEFLDRARYAASTLTRACIESQVLEPPFIPDGFRPSWHKFRVWAMRDVDPLRAFNALRRAGVSVGYWQTRILPDHPAFHLGDDGPRFPIASRVLARTFIVGDQEHPLASLAPSTVDDWAEKIVNLRRMM